MTVIYREGDADLAVLKGARIGVLGYGNQGRSWALNLRDSGLETTVYVRNDETRQAAADDGFEAAPLDRATEADVLCVLIPDDVIPDLDLQPPADALVVLASGYVPAFHDFSPGCDVGMVAPRMLGPEVRETYKEGVGFISAVGVHADVTGTAKARTLAIARAIGGLKQGAIEMTPHDEAVLDLAVEQALAPALRRVNLAFTETLLERGIPLEAILCELFLSGEIERTFRRLRLDGYAAQMAHHSPTSQYGQLSRAERYADVDVAAPMRQLIDEIADGTFAKEWESERGAGYPRLNQLMSEAVGPDIVAWEDELRATLGERSVGPRDAG